MSVPVLEVQDLAFVVNCTPQISSPCADPTDHLVQMPAGRRCRSAAFQALGNERPELDRPAPDRLLADAIPRCARSSSTPRKLRLKRKYSHTAWRMTSAGNRWRLNEIDFTKHHPRQRFRPPQVETS